MWSKVRYPDDYIRMKRSILAAADITYIYEDEPGWFSVIVGYERYTVRGLDDALDTAASCILYNGPVDNLSFIQEGPNLWRPDTRGLLRDLEQAKSLRRK